MSENILDNVSDGNISIAYRPHKFNEVVGQFVALKLLKSALINDRLPRSMVLYGPSGVGKTTLARLVAAWYVCENREHDDVCGVCSMCCAVQDGTISDILEFDAASNTSIEDIREILDQCDYAPQYSSQKVFIIDEAHMLSRNAIAALLKTLEEAPNHVRFILATTEIEKIPDAIRSRCLSIALHDVSRLQMCDYFKHLCIEKNIKIEDGAITLLASLSNGSMREAISILNQAVLLANGSVVDVALLHSIMSYASNEIIDQLVGFIADGKFVQVFETISALDENISILSVLDQVMENVQKKCHEPLNKEKYLKILIDLNRLKQDAAKISAFDAMITVGLTEIAYQVHSV